MRPLGSHLIAGDLALFFSTSRTGRFSAAWSALPVRREALLRGVYLHVLVSGLLIFALLFGTLFLKAWLDAGAAGPGPFDGDHEGWFYLPLIAGIPCLAGALTSAVAGDRLRARLSVAAGFGIVLGYAACQFLRPPAAVLVCGLTVLALLGGVPPLIHLRRRRPCETTRMPRHAAGIG